MRTCKLIFFFLIISSVYLCAYETKIHKYLRTIEEINSCNIPKIDCVYVINLEKRPEKWEKVQKQFRTFCINPTRVNAVNGWLLNDEEKHELCGHYPMRLTGGQIGCILSHVSLIRDAYNRGFNVIWACEDDVELHGSPYEVVGYIDELNKIAPEWDIFYTSKDFVDSEGKIIKATWHDFRPDEPHEDLDHYLTDYALTKEITKIGQRYGTASMLVSRRGMKKILDYFTSLYLWTAYDIDIPYIPNIKQYALNRDLASADIHSTSDTGQDNLKQF